MHIEKMKNSILYFREFIVGFELGYRQQACQCEQDNRVSFRPKPQVMKSQSEVIIMMKHPNIFIIV